MDIIKRNAFLLVFICILSFTIQGCLQCISGGNLHIRKKYVSNVCGLVNGVYVSEIRVDSFKNDLPFKYSTISSASLYRQGASPNHDPKRLYYTKDCKRIFLWKNDRIYDTLNTSFAFKQNSWYQFHSSDAHTDIFIFIDKSGKRHFNEVSGKAGLINF
jgi:hypothetical protein